MNRQEKRFVLLGVALAALVLLGLAYPMFLGRVYSSTDLANFSLPARDFYARCLADGVAFIWWPNQLSGMYLHGEGQAGLYHPINLALYSIASLELALNLEILRSYLLLLPGMFVLLRRLRLPGEAAIFGALLFTFSAFSFLHYMHLSVTPGIAHFPWLLFAIHVILTDERRPRVIAATLGIVLLTASQLLVTHPQIVWLSIVLEVGFTLAVLRAGAGPGRGARAARLVAAKLLGALCASIQLLPVWVTLWDSFRGAPDAQFLSSFALEPLDFLQLVSPYLVRFRPEPWFIVEFGLYCGAVVPVLLVWLILRLRFLGGLRGPAIVALGGAVACLVLALGAKGGLYQLQVMLPVVGLFRAPARYILLFQFCTAVAAAIAFMDLRRVAESGARQARQALWPLAIPLVLSFGFIVVGPLAGLGLQPRLGGPDWVWAAPILFLISTGLVVGAALGARGMLMAILAFAAFDLGAYGLSFVWLDEPVDLVPWVEGRLPSGNQKFMESLTEHRILQGDPVLAIAGVRQAGGYVSMTPRRRLLQPRIQGRALRRQFAELRSQDLATRNAVYRVASVAWEYNRAVPDPLPRARLVSRAQQSLDPLADIARIDVRDTVLVQEPIELSGGPLGTARITRDRPAEISIEVDADTRQMLVLAESFHPGWKVDIDGQPGEVVRAYGDFMGVVIEPGSHSVGFEFDPQSLRVGKTLTTLGLAMTLLWLLGEAFLHPSWMRGCSSGRRA